jgi:PAS domain S-box-containing protein
VDGSDEIRPDSQPRTSRKLTLADAVRQRDKESVSAELEAGRRLQLISTQLIDAEGVQALYSLILDAAMANLHADFASIHLLSTERGELRLMGNRGFGPEAARFRESVHPGPWNTCGVAMRTKRRTVVSDIETCEFMAGSDDLKAYLGKGIRAVQTTPLFTRSGTLLGMFSTHWREPYKLTEAEERTLDVVARELADLIEHDKDENALRLVQQKLAAIHVHSPVAISLIKLPEETIADVNPAWERFFECAREQAVGKTSIELGLACDPAGLALLYSELRDKGVVRDRELTYRTGGGQGRLGSFSLDRIDIGGQMYYLETAIDITEHKRAETALRESEQRLAADLDAMTRLQKLGMLFIREGNSNAVLCELVDAAIAISEAEFGNIQILDAGGGELRIAAQRGFPEWWIDFWNKVTAGHGVCGAALERGESVLVEDVEKSPIFAGSPALEALLRAGVRAVQSTPLVSRSGKSLGMLSVHYKRPHVPDERALRLLDLLSRHAADIIERAQAEEALRETNNNLEKTVQERTAQLAYRATQLRALAGELARSEQRERQRLAQVLHDGLQQILVGAKYRLDSVFRSKDAGDGLDQVAELIDDAIETSRSLTVELSPPVLLEGDLSLALEWLARWMHDKYELETHVSARDIADRLAQDVILVLFQAVRELLFNVVKYAGVNSARVSVSQTDDHILVAVEDEGVGFDPKEVRTGGGQSGGLGLFSISERLSNMNGRLEIESAAGQGSRFRLVVPCAPATAVVDQASVLGRIQAGVPASEPSDYERSGVRQLRIVLADDHIVMRQGLAGLLRLEPDFEVAGEASDGEAAVGLVRELRPDVVVMDVSMPGMDGVEATRLIHREHPGVRVIGLSMFDSSERAAAMLEAGAVNYLAKSGPPEALIEAIRASVQIQI